MRQGNGVVALAVTIPLVTVVADPLGWYPFGPSKWIVISTLIPAGLARLWWVRPAWFAPRATRAVAVLVAWLTVSASFGQDRLYAWIGTPERRLGVISWILIGLMFVAGQSLDPDRDRRTLSWAIVAAGFMTGGLATAEALGWEPDLFAVTPGRLTATMGSAAYLGAVTAVLLPVLVGLVLDQGGWPETDAAPERRVIPPRVGIPRTQRIAAAVAALVTAIACVGSGARAAWLGLAVAGAVLVVARRRSLFVHRRRALGLAGALALGLVMLMVISPFGHRLAQATDPDAAGGRSRVDEWRVAVSVIAHHPVTGVGPEGYRVSFAEGVTDGYEQAYGRDPLPDRAHAGPLDVALAGGLPALLAWAVAVGWMLRAAYRVMRAADADHRWLAGLGAAFVAHLAGQLLLFPTAELEPLLWMVGGLLVATDQVFAANTDNADHAGRPDEMVRRRAILLPRFVPCLLGAVALVAAYAGARDVAADHQAAEATARAGRGDVDGAVVAASVAVALRPDELRLHLLLAQSLEAAERGTGPALAAVDDGLAYSPGDPIAQRHRARLLVRRAGATHLPDDVDRARRYLADLIDHDQANAALHLLDGTTARLAGDAPAAAAAFTRAEILAPREATASIELSRLFLDTGRVAEARAAADRAVARAPQSPQALEARRRASEALPP